MPQPDAEKSTKVASNDKVSLWLATRDVLCTFKSPRIGFGRKARGWAKKYEMCRRGDMSQHIGLKRDNVTKFCIGNRSNNDVDIY